MRFDCDNVEIFYADTCIEIVIHVETEKEPESNNDSSSSTAQQL